MTTQIKTVDDYVLEILQNGAANTYELRNQGIFSPARSIERLKKKGYIIVTTKTIIVDKHGILHKGVAEYHLEGGDNE